MKKKLFRDEYLVNPNCNHYELDPDDTPMPDRYDNYGCDCDMDCPPPPPPMPPLPNEVNRPYHARPPFPPPHGLVPPHIPNVPPQPRFPSARRPIVLPRRAITPPPCDPVLDHYLVPEKHYAQWMIQQLRKYPRLDDRCVVEGLWTFCNDIILRNPHSCIDTPAMWHGDRLESSIIFADHCCKELGRINFYRTKSGEAGIALQLGENAVGIKQPNAGDPTTTETFTTYPTVDDSEQIARCDWVLAKIQAALDGIMDDYLKYFPFDETPTEGSEKGVTSDGIWKAIHNLNFTFDTTPTEGSENPVTSDGIWQAIQDAKPEYGGVEEGAENPCTGDTIYKYITKVLNKIIAGEDPDPQDPVEIPEIELPVASKQQLGIMQVGEYLSVLNGLVSVDIAALRDALGLGGTATSDSWTTITKTVSVGRASAWDQGEDGFPWFGETNSSFINAQTGTTNSYLVPTIVYGHNASTGLSQNTLIKGVTIGTTITCKNTSTNVTIKYVPVRTVGYMSQFSVSQGGYSEGGLAYQVTICVFYRKNDYTLTSADIAEINAEASEFLAQSPTWSNYTVNNGIYDTGVLS